MNYEGIKKLVSINNNVTEFLFYDHVNLFSFCLSFKLASWTNFKTAS